MSHIQIQFTDDAKCNESSHLLLLWESGWWAYRGLGFYTLAAWAEKLEHVYPNPTTVALSVQSGAKGILTLKDNGDFVSWE